MGVGCLFHIKLRNLVFPVLFSLIIILSFSSCRKENYFSDGGAKLVFSTDTVMFDTVFTTLGSATQVLKVYNPYNKTIKISSIELGGLQSSYYSINVNGMAGHRFKDVDIPAGDSIFILTRVTINPGNLNTPFVVADSIIFETNGGLQNVKLVAWGQDAYYHTPTHYYPNFPPFSIIDCSLPWTNDKPHIIYGWAVVDSASALIMEAGTRVHLHKDAVLWVYKDATLKIQGTKEQPVVIQGTRLESYYSDVPGQWGRIWLSAGSKDNEIAYAHILNGTIGLHVDTLGNSSAPTLILQNSIISNMSLAALYAQGSYIVAENTVFANAAQYCVALALGGSYSFTHCSMGNYWRYGNRTTPALILNNYYEDIHGVIQVRHLEKAWFGNCIVYGNNENEVVFDKHDAGTFSYFFDHALLKIAPETNTSDPLHFSNVIKNPPLLNIDGLMRDPVFKDYSKNDFRLFAQSRARNVGSSLISQDIIFDINGENRMQDGFPDLGAYEYMPE